MNVYCKVNCLMQRCWCAGRKGFGLRFTLRCWNTNTLFPQLSTSLVAALRSDWCSADRQEVKCVAGGGDSRWLPLWGNSTPSGEMMCWLCEAGRSCCRLCLRLLMSHQTLMRHKGWWECSELCRTVSWCVYCYLHPTPTWHHILCLRCKKHLVVNAMWVAICRWLGVSPAERFTPAGPSLLHPSSQPITDVLLTGHQLSSCCQAAGSGASLPTPQCATSSSRTHRRGVASGKVRTRGRQQEDVKVTSELRQLQWLAETTAAVREELVVP